MSARRIWFPRDCQFTADPKVEPLGVEFGAEGVLVAEEMIGLAKLARDGGRFEASYGQLGRRAFVKQNRKVKSIVERAIATGLIELESISGENFVATLANWTRWNDLGAADRKAQSRAKTRPDTTEDAAAMSRKSHGDVTEKSRPENVTKPDMSRRTVKQETYIEIPPISPPNEKSVETARKAGFDDWLADHQAVTARRPPGERTKAYASLAESFNARLEDGLSLDDLKLATRGAHGNDFRREHGYDRPDSVLRPTKCHDLVEDGRRMANAPPSSSGAVPLKAKFKFARAADDQPEWPELEDTA